MFRKSQKNPFMDTSSHKRYSDHLLLAEHEDPSSNYTPFHVNTPSDREFPEEHTLQSPLKETPYEDLDSDLPETIIGPEISIKGEMRFNRFLSILGNFEGQLISEGKLFIGASGEVIADLQMQEVIVEGIVKGNITAKRVELRCDAQVHGNIIAKSLKVDEGVCLIGEVLVSSESSPTQTINT